MGEKYRFLLEDILTITPQYPKSTKKTAHKKFWDFLWTYQALTIGGSKGYAATNFAG